MADTQVHKRAVGARTKHAVKRQLLLEAAARQMNERGAGAINLSEIAEQAGHNLDEARRLFEGLWRLDFLAATIR